MLDNRRSNLRIVVIGECTFISFSTDVQPTLRNSAVNSFERNALKVFVSLLVKLIAYTPKVISYIIRYHPLEAAAKNTSDYQTVRLLYQMKIIILHFLNVVQLSISYSST